VSPARATPARKSARKYLEQEADRTGRSAAARPEPGARRKTEPARAPVTLTARQAAAALQVSERYVRQLAAAGTLTVVTTAPLKVTADSVTAAQQARADRPLQPPRPRTMDLDTLQAVIAAVLAEALPVLTGATAGSVSDLERRVAALETAVERLAVDLRQRPPVT